MARPSRNDVDYFPFFCKEGKAMFYIEEKYGNDGFASWVKILRSLATTNFHYLNLSDTSEKMFLSAKCKVSESTLEGVINDLCSLGEFDKYLWDEFNVVWSDKFIESIADAYKKRNNMPFDKKSLVAHLEGKSNPKQGKSTPKPEFPQLKGGENPQTKLKKTKVNYTKVDLVDRENEFRLQLKNYLGEYSDDLLKNFFDYWTEPNKSKTKMKFEQQKTWDLNRRLKRWASQSFNKNGNTEKKLTRFEKFAEQAKNSQFNGIEIDTDTPY